jgi:hypothetical protein
MRRRDGSSPRRLLSVASPLEEWRAEFAESDAFVRIQIRVRLARLVAVERDPVVRAALKGLLEEMRMCR